MGLYSGGGRALIIGGLFANEILGGGIFSGGGLLSEFYCSEQYHFIYLFFIKSLVSFDVSGILLIIVSAG